MTDPTRLYAPVSYKMFSGTSTYLIIVMCMYMYANSVFMELFYTILHNIRSCFNRARLTGTCIYADYNSYIPEFHLDVI